MHALVVVALGLPLAAATAGAVDVTACGQTIGAGEVGVLQRSLACASDPTWPFSAEGVRLSGGATLDLNGFVIQGDGTGVGVTCLATSRRRSCVVTGPGEVRGFWAGVNCGGCRIVARDATFRDNVNGIYVPLSGTVRAERVVTSENAETGIWAHRLRGVDLEASENGAAGLVANERLAVRRLEAVGNGREGVRCAGFVCGRSRIVESTVAGNDVSGPGYDIASTGPVRLRDVTCARSARLHYPSWRDGDYDTVVVVGSFGCTGD